MPMEYNKKEREKEENKEYIEASGWDKYESKDK